MKKILLLLITTITISFSSFSQSSTDSFNTNDITWFGIDYTQCYFLNPIDFPSRDDLKVKIRAWNDLILNERDKYIGKTLPGKNVKFATNAVNEKNSEIEIKSHITEDGSKSKHLEMSQIQEIINGFKIEDGLNGTGLLLIAESYDKPAEHGNYYVAFFDIETKKIFVSERYSGKAKGGGIRNYWAGSYYKVLQAVGKKY